MKYSQMPLYGHLLNTDTSLYYTHVCMYAYKKEQKHEKYPLAKKQYFFQLFFLVIINITCTLPHLIYINKELLQIHKIHYLHLIMVIKED